MPPDTFWIGYSGTRIVLLSPESRPQPLEKAAPEDVAPLLKSGRGRSCRLHLDATLPESWQTTDWEGLLRHHAGYFQVVRQSAEAPTPTGDTGDVLLFSRWPRPAELKPLERHIPPLRISPPSRSNDEVLLRMLRERPPQCLIILAHGGESQDGALLDEHNNAWRPALPPHLPPLVMFLACEGQGSLDELVREALDRGARTLVTASGRLDFARTLAWLDAWLEKRPPLAGWLAERCREDATAGGPRAIRLWGEAPESIPQWRQKLDHLERQSVREGTQPGALLEQAHPCGYPETPAWLAEVSNGLLPLAPRQKGWLLPYLLHCAERHDHRLSRGLRKAMKDLPKACQDTGPWSAYHECADHRRGGRYPEACRILSPYLAPEVMARESQEFQAAALGMLLNLLLDLDLPNCALEAQEQLSLVLTSGKCMDERAFEKLDRDARLALRQGKLGPALSAYRLKRQEARNGGEVGLRELAGMLNAAAWWQAPQAAALAAECRIHLLNFPDTIAALQDENGNSDLAYLLRAYAIHAWRGRSEEHRQELRRWIPACLDSFSRPIDPGPPAMTLMVAGAAGLADEDAVLEASKELQDEGYHLELVCLWAALGNQEESWDAFTHFREQRRQSLVSLRSAQVLGLDWQAAEGERTPVECAALMAPDFRPWLAGIQPV